MLKRTRSKIGIGILAVLVAGIVVVRLYMDVWLTDYVNGVLDDLNGYHGSIRQIRIHLYRGAYAIDGLKITKKQGKFYAPFISADSIDLSLQWQALMHGRIVSDIHITNGTANFAVDKTGAVSQTGKEIDWSKKAKDLMPIDINEITIDGGKIAYRDFSSTPQVDIYMTDMTGKITNLRNVTNKSKPLPSTFQLKGNSIGHGTFALAGRANILKKMPDVELATQLENVDLPALNSYSNAYGAIDFNSGKLSVYSEVKIIDGKVTGYVKPIATNISMVDLRHDRNPFKIAWKAFVSGLVQIFKNQSKDQFATKVELSGNLGSIESDSWSTIVGIFHNAFVKAFDKKLDKNVTDTEPTATPAE